ncbi:MAG: extracellular substrate binding-like orphan protein GrrP [Cyanobacteria bacterium]|nr:extracellular substrate binding-like orphan protein GrrP [Cyanobacteriota bacterium]
MSRLLPATLSLLAALAPMAQARAEGVVDRVARSGELVLVGIPEVSPLLSLNAKGEPQGYGVAVARQVQAELAAAVGRPVTLRFEAVKDGAALGQSIATGKADLACGIPFTWERDAQLDYSLPIGLSGLRLLAPVGRFDGAPAGLSGRRIGVVANSLAATELQGMQPAAIAVPFASLGAAVAALKAGSVAGVIGDSLVLAGLARTQGASGLTLTPEEPYERFAIACLVPENDSAFRNLVNLAIARLLQGYLNGQPEAVAAIDRWVGPGSSVNLSADLIRTYFETVLLGVEAIRPLPATTSSGSSRPGS